MAEPNHNAEDLLKRYAADRRARAAKEIHPATRRLLQGEVARVYGSAKGALPWWRKLAAPRLAWSLALVAILGVSIVSLRRPAPIELPEVASTKAKAPAEKEISLGLEVALDSAAVPVKAEAAQASAPSPTDRFLAENAAGRGAVLTDPAPANRPVARGFGGGAAQPGLAGRELQAATPERKRAADSLAEVEVLARRERDNRSDLAVVAATAAAPPASVPAPALPQAQMLYFSNQSPASPVSAQKTRAVATAAGAVQNQILNRFSLLPSGGQLQVTDEDGSLYKGAITTQQLTQAGYAFRVSGTNNTLRQPVTFTGQVVQIQPPALRQTQNETRYQRAAPAQNSFYDNASNNQLRLQGQATVGQDGIVTIDAQNTAPAPAQK